MRTWKAFTLAELLIALAILGVIATFTIPKVLNSQNDGRYNSIAKEAAASVSQAYQLYRKDNTVDANTRMLDLIPYLNYVRQQTTGTIDHRYTLGTLTCSGTYTGRYCYVLHNGAMLVFLSALQFDGTGPTNAISFNVDPDGKVTDGTTNGPGKSVQFFLYLDGRLRTRGTVEPNTQNSVETANPTPSEDPPWFSWN